MLIQESHSRPRNLRWFLAGPLLYGDVGTSRLYVLGLAIYFAGKSAPYYVTAVGLLLILVGWAYTIICRTHPDGGGVYSSAREVHPTLGLIGATLLFTDYIVTAAISTFEAIKYVSVPLQIPVEWDGWLSVIVLGLLGVLNFVGPRRAGTFALTIAVACIVTTAFLAGFAVPHVAEGIHQIARPPGHPGHWWVSFVDVVLALSGIEAISNMTGIMHPPVRRTTNLSIWPVIGEVVLFNILLIIAISSLPGLTLPDGAPLASLGQDALNPAQLEVRDRIIGVAALAFVGPHFAAAASVLFGLLLISASNTAILGMVNIQFSMSRDRELPGWFSRLNQYGVPWWGLYAACILPAAIILLAQSTETLAGMYAIGVVGAICINLGCTAWNRKLDIRNWERSAMWALGGLMLAIWVTIAFTKPLATVFLTVMLVGGATLRLVAKRFVQLPIPIPGVAGVPAEAAEAPPGIPFDPSKGRILLSTRGNLNLVKFGVKQAKQNNANLFVLFVRELAVLYPGQTPVLTAAEDADASHIFRESERLAREAEVPLQLIYATSDSAADVILDSAATYAADQVILGVSRRAAVMRALRGDVIEKVAANLPEESTLLIHA